MPIIKFVNESEKIEYSTEQDVCSLLCYAFDPQKTIMNDNQFVGCKPFGFPFWYMRNPLAVHQFMEFNHLSRRGMQYANNTVASRGGYMAENFVADSYNLDATIKRSDAPRATVPEENGLSSPDIQYGDEQASLKFYKDAKSSAMRQSDPGYGDQHRIVPSDQVDDAKAELAKKAQENRAKGRENAATQQEKTRDLIDD